MCLAYSFADENQPTHGSSDSSGAMRAFISKVFLSLVFACNVLLLLLLLLFFIQTDRMPLPKVDLMFVISAQSSNAYRTFPHMKKIITDIMQNYSANKIHYAVMVYGDEPSLQLTFSQRITDQEKLQELVNSIPNVKGGAALDKALRKAKEIFDEDEAVRAGAVKVLVIIADEASSGNKEDAKAAAKELDVNRVEIITVAVGKEAGHDELENLTSTKGDVLNTTTNVDPGKTGEEIMRKISEGRC